MAKQLLLIVLTVTNFVSCAQFFGTNHTKPEEQFYPELCNYQTAFEFGVYEARMGKLQNDSFAGKCDSVSKTRALAGYNEGYRYGYDTGAKNSFLKKAPPEADSNSQESTVFSGVQKKPRPFFCRIDLFTTQFEGRGSDLKKAKQDVFKKCTKNHSPLLCEEILCKKFPE